MNREHKQSYEDLINEEDSLVEQVETCQDIINILLDNVYHKAESWNMYVAEEIVLAVQEIEQKIQKDLLLLRLEKSQKALLMQ